MVQVMFYCVNSYHFLGKSKERSIRANVNLKRLNATLYIGKCWRENVYQIYTHTHIINIFQGVCTHRIHCFHGGMSCPTNSNVCALCPMTIPSEPQLITSSLKGQDQRGRHGNATHASCCTAAPVLDYKLKAERLANFP